MHDRDPKSGEADRRRPPQRAEADGGHDAYRLRIESLSQAAGNAAVSRMLDPGVSRAIEADLGSGRTLSDTAPAAPATSGVDPSQVHVHDDARAASLAGSLDAVAFTYGSDIFLAGDAPALGSPEGQRVIAHELTHVRQQDGAQAGPPTQVSSPESPAEREATRVGDSVGAAATAPAAAVHRQEVEEEELAMMAAGTVHRQGDEEEEIALMETGTVHRQPLEEEEEIVATMPAGTVHRQGDEEEEIALMETGTVHRQEALVEEDVAGDESEAAPANPALASLFDASVVGNHRNAAAYLAEDPARVEDAMDAVDTAITNLDAVRQPYEASDPLLFIDLGRYRNGLLASYETLLAMVHGPRSPEVANRALGNPANIAMGERLRDRLH